MVNLPESRSNHCLRIVDDTTLLIVGGTDGIDLLTTGTKDIVINGYDINRHVIYTTFKNRKALTSTCKNNLSKKNHSSPVPFLSAYKYNKNTNTISSMASFPNPRAVSGCGIITSTNSVQLIVAGIIMF